MVCMPKVLANVWVCVGWCLPCGFELPGDEELADCQEGEGLSDTCHAPCVLAIARGVVCRSSLHGGLVLVGEEWLW